MNFWYAVEFAHEVTTKPKRITVLGQELVLFRQPRSGNVICMSDLCVHRGGALSEGWLEGDNVVCPYHGWEFASDGACVKVPANPDGRAIPKKARVDSYPTQEKYKFVWVFLGDLPEAERPPLPNWDQWFEDPNLTAVYGEYRWNANYERVLENGVDIAHTPFVHGAAFGNRKEPQIPDYDMDVHEWGASVTVTMKPPKENVKGVYKRKWKVDKGVTVTTAWHMPNLAMINPHIPFGQIVIFDTNIPVDENTTLTKWIAFRDFFKGKWADKDAKKRVHAIFLQDAPIVESQRPELLPMDLAGELHMRSDAMSVAYRRKRNEALDRGWGVESHRIKGNGPDDFATVIPSPARREVPELARAWVLKEVETSARSRATVPGLDEELV